MVKGKRGAIPADPADPQSEESSAGPEMITLDKDIFGNPYLPGQEVTVVKEVYEKAHAYESSKIDHARITKQLTEDKKALAAATRKHRNFFEGTNDGLHFVYPCAGIDVLVDRKEQVSTKAESSADPVKKKGKKKKAEAAEEIY